MTSCSHRGPWHPLHIVAVVAGFLIWWPLGLAALIYFIWGGRFRGEKLRDRFERARERARNEFGGFTREWSGASPTGNAAFDEYRRETLRRLEEERRRL